MNESTPLVNESQVGKGVNNNLFATCSCIIQEIRLFCEANSFVLKAALAIGLAKLYPPMGSIYLRPEITATWLAVFFIFFMAGLSLKSSEFTKAATRLWFNTFVLAFNFFVVSFLVFGVTCGIRYLNLVSQGLTDGMIVCSCLPVTVTMVIVLTKSAHGDEAAAVLIAAVGSLAGVFVSPTLILVYIGIQSTLSMSSVFFKLLLRIMIPVMVGQIIQFCSSATVAFVESNKTRFKAAQEWALIYIIYTVFCTTFSNPIEAAFVDILWMALFQCMCLLASMLLAWYSLKICFRNEPRLRVMGFYGCTQKSVAVGIPLIGAVYENDPRAGMFTLPLLIWHPAQLLIGSALAPRLAEGVEVLEDGYLSLPESQRRESMRRSFFASSTSDSMRRASTVAFEPFVDFLQHAELEDEDET